MTLPEDFSRAKDGDRHALDRMLMRIQPKLRQMTEKRLGKQLRTEVAPSDILQSTYLEIIRGVARFDGASEDAFVAWVATILENNIRQKKRYFGAQKRRRPDAVQIDDAAVIGRKGTPSSSARRLEDLLAVSRALDNLPEEYRNVILMKVVEEKTHQEIADATNRTVAATKMLLARARAALALAVERESA